jgi:hypothetical protein
LEVFKLETMKKPKLIKHSLLRIRLGHDKPGCFP